MRIIIADDHAIFRDSLGFLLHNKTEHDVVAEAKSIQELKQTLQSTDAELILIDYHMPEGDTLALAEYIKRRYEPIYVIFLTGSQAGFTLKHLTESSADGVLHKEEDVENIITAINQVASGNKHISEQVKEKISDTDFHLSKREFQILNLIVQGNTSKEIAKLIDLSSRTVDKHKENIMLKMNVSNVVQLVAKTHKLNFFADNTSKLA